jgi:hypothetical protein
LTFIPDSISKDELLRIQVNAEADYVPAEETDTEEVDIDDAIEAAFDKFLEKHPTPAESKAMALRILSQLGTWHDVIAEKLQEKGDEACLTWAGDEKLIHMAWSCLDRVEM